MCTGHWGRSRSVTVSSQLEEGRLCMKSGGFGEPGEA